MVARPDPLTTYRAKRDFAVTSEPTGSPAPSLDPGVRRMAVHVEDHPLEYADFEGVIPGGEYGAGDVIVWDRGTWTSSDRDPAQALHDGELHVELRGEKLRGGFVLVRTTGGRRAAAREQRSGHIRDEWLMIHRRDDDAVEGWDAEDHPRSVRSGRTNDEVAASPASDRWTRDRGLVTGPTSAEPSWDAATPDELEALSALGRTGSWRIGERELRLTNLDKVLFPASGRRAEVTKRDLIAYVAAVAPAMMPYLAGRPVNLHRFPDGADRPGFWQKAVPSHAPAWLSRWRNEEADPGETEWYLVPDGAASLAWMANWGALEWHPWTSTTASPHEPTWALIDIDPGDATTFAEVRRLARRYRDALATLELDGRPKTTGKRGLQIWVPIEPGHSFDDTRRWVEAISLAVARLEPGLVSWSWRTDERGGLARLDYTQNAINKTLVAPFSPRAAAGAPVSVPLAWDDLDDRRLRSDRWSVHDVLRHVRDHGDPLRDLIGLAQPFPRLGG